MRFLPCSFDRTDAANDTYLSNHPEVVSGGGVRRVHCVILSERNRRKTAGNLLVEVIRNDKEFF